MPEEVKKPGMKMKVTGYICIVFAAVISVLTLLPDMLTAAEALPIIYYWGGLGLALLFGNAGKRIGGQAVMNRASQVSSGK